MPVFSPPAGTYTSAQSVTISDATSGATIYYTTDGTTPTTSSALYTGPITVSSSETLEAIAVKSGNTNSAVASAAYTITPPPTVSTPTFTPPRRDLYFGAVGDHFRCHLRRNHLLHHRWNCSNHFIDLYSGAITVIVGQTIEAIAVAPGHTNSAVASAAYTITAAATPVVSPPAGTYTSAQSVTISDATSGATIYYTNDGTAPTTSSNLYRADYGTATNHQGHRRWHLV